VSVNESRAAVETQATQRSDRLPGRLIVIEGIDRSGRSTQVERLTRWLEDMDIPAVRTDWSTSPHISKAIHKAKADGALRPITFSLFYAADFADRVANVIEPALARGEVVVADRYIYTAFARDIARGANRRWLETLYRFAPEPDAVFYLRVSPHVTEQRVPSVPVKALDRYEAGMDLGLSNDPSSSFQMYQQRVVDTFERLSNEYGFIVLDGEGSVSEISNEISGYVRGIVRQ
jgi:dTMP kinase